MISCTYGCLKKMQKKCKLCTSSWPKVVLLHGCCLALVWCYFLEVCGSPFSLIWQPATTVVELWEEDGVGVFGLPCYPALLIVLFRKFSVSLCVALATLSHVNILCITPNGCGCVTLDYALTVIYMFNNNILLFCRRFRGRANFYSPY